MSDSNDFHVAPQQNPDCDCLFCESERAREKEDYCYCGECDWCRETEQAHDTFGEEMDGDHESGLASAGWGTDEDYGCYDSGDDW